MDNVYSLQNKLDSILIQKDISEVKEPRIVTTNKASV